MNTTIKGSGKAQDYPSLTLNIGMKNSPCRRRTVGPAMSFRETSQAVPFHPQATGAQLSTAQGTD